MIKHGPVDVVVLAAAQPRFEGTVFAELEKQSAAGTIRVLDAMLLMKGDEGASWRLDIEDLPEDLKAALGFMETGTRGLFDSEDSALLFEGMVPGSAILALAIEHTWAVPLVNAIYDAGVETALQYRVPAADVDEAFASLAAKA